MDLSRGLGDVYKRQGVRTTTNTNEKTEAIFMCDGSS
jgi:hypothetical protein